MKKLLMSGLVVAIALAATSSRLPAQTKATVTNVPTIPHEAVPNFFKNPPGIYTGENMGIATNSKGNIYIYIAPTRRGSSNTARRARSSARSAAASTATRSRIRYASTPRTTSGRSTKVPT